MNHKLTNIMYDEKDFVVVNPLKPGSGIIVRCKRKWQARNEGVKRMKLKSSMWRILIVEEKVES